MQSRVESRAEIVRVLSARLRAMENPARAGLDDAGGGNRGNVPRPGDVDTAGAGDTVLASLFPRGVLERGMLVEWIAAQPGAGAMSLAVAVARQMGLEHGPTVVIDAHEDFYPPAAVGRGLDLGRTLILRPTRRDLAWTWEQVLHCPTVGTVLGWLEEVHDREYRRLQLAAENARGLGLLLRSARALDSPSWAALRLVVEPLPSLSRAPTWTISRRAKVRVLRLRGGSAGKTLQVEMDDETGTVRLAAEVAAPAVVAGATRA